MRFRTEGDGRKMGSEKLNWPASLGTGGGAYYISAPDISAILFEKNRE
jgi:hypothetical protein